MKHTLLEKEQGCSHETTSCVCQREHTKAHLSLDCSTFFNVKLLIIINYSNAFTSYIQCDEHMDI